MEFSDRSKIKRYVERSSYDKRNLIDILSKAIYCNVSFCINGQPYVIPMNFAFLNNKIYVHGSKDSRIIKELENGKDVSISFVYVEDVVRSKSLCDYSMNYSSAIVFGFSKPVTDKNEKLKFFNELGMKVDPDEYSNAKPPDETELEKVKVISIEIEEFSLKSRIGYRF